MSVPTPILPVLDVTPSRLMSVCPGEKVPSLASRRSAHLDILLFVW